MIQPVCTDDDWLRDVEQARGGVGFRLWWLGQSGYLVQWSGGHVLLDPYLSDSLTRKYAGTDRPHVRLTAPLVAPERLTFIDVVTSSHNHTDHLDAETLVPILRANPSASLVIPEANRGLVADRLGVPVDRPVGLDDGVSASVAGLTISGVAAAHEAVERDAQGRCRYLGYVLRFGPWTIYHSGDTMWYEGLADRLRPWRVDVALLPINGRAPERRVAGNLDGLQAARLSRDIGAAVVIPCHYEMFEFNTASPESFVAECRRLGQPHAVLRCGERWDAQASGR